MPDVSQLALVSAVSIGLLYEEKLGFDKSPEIT
ncbi:unnamed protein product, partial [Protopolystoma xenopodis]